MQRHSGKPKANPESLTSNVAYAGDSGQVTFMKLNVTSQNDGDTS